MGRNKRRVILSSLLVLFLLIFHHLVFNYPYGKVHPFTKYLTSLSRIDIGIFFGNIQGFEISEANTSDSSSGRFDDLELAKQFTNDLLVRQPRYYPDAEPSYLLFLRTFDRHKKEGGTLTIASDKNGTLFFIANGADGPYAEKYKNKWIFFQLTMSFRATIKRILCRAMENTELKPELSKAIDTAMKGL